MVRSGVTKVIGVVDNNGLSSCHFTEGVNFFIGAIKILLWDNGIVGKGMVLVEQNIPFGKGICVK